MHPGQVTVRLVNGRDRLHGRVVLTALGTPGSICKDGFDETDARVICRMLNYRLVFNPDAHKNSTPESVTMIINEQMCRLL